MVQIITIRIIKPTQMTEIVGACAVGVAILMRRKQRQQKSLKCRSSQGAYYHLVQELRLGDVATYRNFVRMDAELITPFGKTLVTHTDNMMRMVISPGERLSNTLRFLATGNFLNTT